jgi:hypothetical protein
MLQLLLYVIASALLALGHDYRSRIANKEARIRHRVYYETVGKWGAQVVAPASADPGLPDARPGRDHIGICKPPVKCDPVHEGVIAFLEDMVLQPREPSQSEKLDELLAITRAGGAFNRAAEQGISEAAVRHRRTARRREHRAR